MNNLAELENKFDDSSCLTHKELLQLKLGLQDIYYYFFDREEYTIASGLGNKVLEVERTISMRRNAGLLDF